MSHAFFTTRLPGKMRPLISEYIKEEIRNILPLVREEVKKEFMRWNDYTPGAHFYSDEKVFELLPYAAYEYILLSWGVEPHLVSMASVIRSLNDKLFFDLRHIVAHTLRRIALQEKLSGKK